MILSVVLCGPHTWSVLLWEEHGMRVLENRVLRQTEFKNILGQLAMATKESLCLNKQYVMKTYGGWRYGSSHSSFRIYTSR